MDIDRVQDLTPQQATWLKAYLDKDNEKTYLNGTQSALIAYNCSTIISAANTARKVRQHPIIAMLMKQYWDDQGMSEDGLIKKLKELMNAEETKFFSHEGKITDQVNVPAHEVRRRTADMMMKVQGMYEKHNAQQSIHIHPPGVDKEEEAGI